MKALSIRQPWAHLIMCGEKEYEYRTWQTEYRGDFLVCASANPKIENTIPGHVLCIVTLNDIIKVTKKNYVELGLDEPPARGETLYAWQLINVRVVNPFHVKGKLNFFNVDDSLIEIIDDGSELPESEAETIVAKYILPKLYKGN